MNVSSVVAASVLVVLGGCGGAARVTRAEPDANGTYDVFADRDVPVGASWDEHAAWQHEERRVVLVVTNEEVTETHQRVELLGRLTVVAADRSSILVTSLTVDDGTGPRALVAPGETLVVQHGEPGVISNANGPLATELDELVRHVVHTGRRDDPGHDGIEQALGPPDGRIAVGGTWTLDDAALTEFFNSRPGDASVRREDVGGSGTLAAGGTWEGHDWLTIGLDMAVHDMSFPVPEGAVVDDVEIALRGQMAWPLDLTVPSPGDSMRMEMGMAMHMETPEMPGVVIQITTVAVDTDLRERSNFRAP